MCPLSSRQRKKQKEYVKYYSKRVTAKDGLWVRKSPSTSGQKCFIIDYNQEIESFGVTPFQKKGDFLNVKITKAYSWHLLGELVK